MFTTFIWTFVHVCRLVPSKQLPPPVEEEISSTNSPLIVEHTCCFQLIYRNNNTQPSHAAEISTLHVGSTVSSCCTVRREYYELFRGHKITEQSAESATHGSQC